MTVAVGADGSGEGGDGDCTRRLHTAIAHSGVDGDRGKVGGGFVVNGGDGGRDEDGNVSDAARAIAVMMAVVALAEKPCAR